jgi:hypothetical protein
VSELHIERVEAPPSPTARRALRRARFRLARGGTARIPWLIILGVVVSAEIVVWTGQATNWFGWVPGTTGSSSPSGPNPNPYNETVQAVVANVTYTGNLTGYFPALQMANVCNGCPRLPVVQTNHTPPNLGFRFYFNVTNTAEYLETIVNFTLATSGTNGQLFMPGYVVCCYPSYGSYSAVVMFTPGQTVGVEVYVHAVSLPDVGPAGYTLYFNVTSPQPGD